MARKPTPQYVVRPFWTRIAAFFLLFLFVGSLIGMTATRVILGYELQSDIGHKVEEGFHTVSGPASSEQLGQAIAAAEEQGLTHGYTNWLWKSKCGDIGFWYETLKQAKADVDRASYERAWAPEADENAILQRHYFVLVTTFGDDMMPCGMHLVPHKAFFDLWAWSLLPLGLGAITMTIVQGVIADESRIRKTDGNTRCINCGEDSYSHGRSYARKCKDGYEPTLAPMRAGFFGKLVRPKDAEIVADEE